MVQKLFVLKLEPDLDPEPECFYSGLYLDPAKIRVCRSQFTCLLRLKNS